MTDSPRTFKEYSKQIDGLLIKELFYYSKMNLRPLLSRIQMKKERIDEAFGGKE